MLLENVTIRNLETPVLYNYLNNEMFELDDEALNAVKLFNGNHSLEEISKITGSSIKELKELTDYLIEENLLKDKKVETKAKPERFYKSPLPSLRTILVHITNYCNLDCVHCYVDKSQRQKMKPEIFYKTINQFDELQGLKVLISGGEPLTHPKFFEMMEQIKKIKIRKVLLTNGILLNDQKIQRLKGLVQEVQISLDGTKSHNQFRRMENAFNQSLKNIKKLKENGFTISISTMIHNKNLGELHELEKILKDLKVDNWYLDVPTVTGEYKNHPNFNLDPETAGNTLKRYGYGQQFYYESEQYACGAHLCAIMVNGDVAKCGFFEDQTVGNIKNKTLKECWELIQQNYIWEQKELKCSEMGCEYLKDCKGGCRYRAFVDTGDIYGIDKVKCAYFGCRL
ncbi:MAG: radical SAM protein [Candidatus Jordarchaeum sp.]|uniref:radical SAM protein n=1 Tax=Candidatus Jordarchaeum sp. TaxID=2823881 RepID=UPI00404AAB9F